MKRTIPTSRLMLIDSDHLLAISCDKDFEIIQIESSGLDYIVEIQQKG